MARVKYFNEATDKWEYADVAGGEYGITKTAKGLALTLFQNAEYTSDQSENLAALETALTTSGSSGGGASVSEVTLATSFVNAAEANTILEAMTNHDYTLFIYTGESTAENQIYSAVIDKTVTIQGHHLIAYNRYRSGSPAIVGGVGSAYTLTGFVGDTFLMIGGDAP